MTRRASVLVLAPIVVLLACGGSSAAPTGAALSPGATAQTSPPVATVQPTPEAPASQPAATERTGTAGSACELLTDADILELTGLRVQSVETRSAGGVLADGCFWALGDAPDISVLLGRLSTGGRAYYDTYVAPYAQANGLEPLSGIGDVGLVAGDGSGSVKVVVGDTALELELFSLSGANEAALATALIERALSRLSR